MSTYLEKLKRFASPDNRSPAYLERIVRGHCGEAAKRFVDDPDRVPERCRNFLVQASHYWHGGVQELIQVNASRERIQEVFAECQSYNGIKLDVCEEIVRFKLAGPEEREGIVMLIGEAVEQGWDENYAISQAIALLQRCSQGYDV